MVVSTARGVRAGEEGEAAAGVREARVAPVADEALKAVKEAAGAAAREAVAPAAGGNREVEAAASARVGDANKAGAALAEAAEATPLAAAPAVAVLPTPLLGDALPPAVAADAACEGTTETPAAFDADADPAAVVATAELASGGVATEVCEAPGNITEEATPVLPDAAGVGKVLAASAVGKGADGVL